MLWTAASFTLALLALAALTAAAPDGTGPTGSEIGAADAYTTAAELSGPQRELYGAGRALFARHWVVAPSATGPWGRGPTSNGESCTDCHRNNGGGRVPSHSDQPLRSALVRLSIGSAGQVLPHPAYGSQLQFQGVLGKVPGEGEAYVEWVHSSATLADGEVVDLRRPRLRFAELAFGPLGDDVLTSLRVAPRLMGLGLLEAVAPETLERLAEAQRERGLHGRLHAVPDLAGNGMLPGRFGYKSAQPGIVQQVAAALHEDLGVTSAWLPAKNCPEVQHACRRMPPPAYPEASEQDLDSLAFYVRTSLPPPPRNAPDMRGARVFVEAGCAECHLPSLVTDDYAPLPAFSRREVHAYTDLLLHDMGEALSDGRPELGAGAREWRTAPLWGIGLARAVDGEAVFLHDGRARNVQEAILWHSGEAGAARNAYAALSRGDRLALLAFLNGL